MRFDPYGNKISDDGSRNLCESDGCQELAVAYYRLSYSAFDISQDDKLTPMPGFNTNILSSPDIHGETHYFCAAHAAEFDPEYEPIEERIVVPPYDKP